MRVTLSPFVIETILGCGCVCLHKCERRNRFSCILSQNLKPKPHTKKKRKVGALCVSVLPSSRKSKITHKRSIIRMGDHYYALINQLLRPGKAHTVTCDFVHYISFLIFSSIGPIVRALYHVFQIHIFISRAHRTTELRYVVFRHSIVFAVPPLCVPLAHSHNPHTQSDTFSLQVLG